MNATNVNTDLEKSCMLLMEIIKEKDVEIAELKNRSVAAGAAENVVENEAVKFFALFQRFVSESMVQKWCVERKYTTELSQNYVDVDFKKYRQFVDGNLDRHDHGKFRAFLLDLQLIEPATFEKERGLIAGSAKDRKRVLRIRAEVYKRLAAG